MSAPSFTPGPWKYEATYQGMLSDKNKGFPFVVQGTVNGFTPQKSSGMEI